MISHAAAINRLYGMQEVYRLMRDDIILQKTPISFDVSVWEIFWTLMTGACMVIPSPGDHRDVARLIDLIKAHRVTTLHFVPTVLDLFLQHPDVSGCESLRRVFCGGELLRPQLQRKFFESLDAELHHLYGPTEATIDVTAWACQRHHAGSTIPIGRPVPNVTIYVLNEDGQPVDDEREGEIVIGGSQLAIGYLNKPDLTAKAFIKNPWSSDPQARLYRTGDKGRWRRDGCLEFLGRFDHQIKLRGIRIELQEVEAVLHQHPNVRQCIINLHGEGWQAQLIAFVVAHDQKTKQEAWRSHMAERIPEAMIPSRFVLIDKMPLTTTGKIDRKALEAYELSTDEVEESRQRTEASGAPIDLRTPTQLAIHKIWSAVLGSQAISNRDDFFRLGGDSLRAIRVTLAIAKEFGLKMRMVVFFAGPTIAEQAAWIDEQLAAPRSGTPQECLAKIGRAHV